MTQVARDVNGSAIQAIYPGTTQLRTFTVTSANSTAMQATTNVVRLICTQDCHIVFGAAPTATTTDMRLKADVAEYFAIKPGDFIAAIRASADGTLQITEAANF